MEDFEGKSLGKTIEKQYIYILILTLKVQFMIGIYKITSPSKRVYIGQSINIEKRLKSYKRLHCTGQILLYRSFLKYGFEKHKFEILCECEVIELNDKERYYQDLYSAMGIKGLNCKLTKSNDRNSEHSIETKLKLSRATSKNRLGKKHSIETKQKIGLAHIGNKHNLGNKMSENTKNKLAECNKGNKHNLGKKASEESKIKQSKLMKGNKHCLGREISEVTRNRISQSNKGKIVSVETKNKMASSKIKLILDLQIGVFLFGIKEASITYSIEKSSLTKQLNGRTKNKTNLIYV